MHWDSQIKEKIEGTTNRYYILEVGRFWDTCLFFNRYFLHYVIVYFFLDLHHTTYTHNVILEASPVKSPYKCPKSDGPNESR